MAWSLLRLALFAASFPSLSFSTTAAAPVDASSQAASQLRFDLATIKPNPSLSHWAHVQFTGDGFSAMGVSLRVLLQEAYGISEDQRLIGGPGWVDASAFDVVGKVDSEDAPRFAALPLEARRVVLQQLLAERFSVRVHHEQRSFRVFDPVVAPGGSKLVAVAPPQAFGASAPPSGQLRRAMPGQLTVMWASMPAFAQRLSAYAHRIVVDHTHLEGRYNIELDWMPDVQSASGPEQPMDSGAPPLPRALEQQLGLRLAGASESLDVVVVDHAARPTPD